MLFKAMRAAAVVGALYYMSPERARLPDLPPAALGLPVQLGLPMASTAPLPNLSQIPPSILPAMLSRIQDAASNSGVPDLGPFTPGRTDAEVPPPPSADLRRQQTFADRWAQAPDSVRRQIASLVAHRGTRMLAAGRE
jgi:hypothetical protein